MMRSRTSRIILDQLKQAERGYRGNEAIVIGASMGGLMAARVLAEHFETVTILERDILKDSTAPRKGAPQGNHTHALLQAGSEAIEELFPGFWGEMVRRGTTPFDSSGDFAWYHHGVWKARRKTGLLFYMQSRPMLEYHVRKRLLKDYPNVRLIDDCQVTSLMHDDQRKEVKGVVVQFGYDGAKAHVDFPAELVVDVSGRQTRTPRWLKDLGYGEVPVEEAKIDICYSTRFYKPPENFERDWQMMVVYSKAPNKRIAYISPVEGNRWIVTLAGYHGDHPPENDDEFLDFTDELPRGEYREAMQRAKPLTASQRYKMPSDLRRFYERMRKFPRGLIVMGDANCSFNPIFGQGITTATLGAMNLRACLRRQATNSLKGISKRFRRKSKTYNDIAWLLATTEDMRYEETEAKRPFGLAFLNWYKATILEMSGQDKDVAYRFLKVMHFQQGLSAILHPMVILKALAWPLRRKAAMAASQDVPPRPASAPRKRAKSWGPGLGLEYIQ